MTVLHFMAWSESESESWFGFRLMSASWFMFGHMSSGVSVAWSGSRFRSWSWS